MSMFWRMQHCRGFCFAVSRIKYFLSVRGFYGPVMSCYSSTSSEQNSKNRDICTSIMKHLLTKIKATGPITVAEYMREVLTNPVMGYYVGKNMLGTEGDFVTSPEISQVFGELVGVWCISEWMSAGKPKDFQIVELGPGRGSLMSDVLRVFSQLNSILTKSQISVHLVEVSPKLAEIQAENLTVEKTGRILDENAYKQGFTQTGLSICWYRSLQDVPRGCAFYLANEFFDALPIHKFQKTEQGWREILVDVNPQLSNELRFVLAPFATLSSETLIKTGEERMHVEVSPDAGLIIETVTDRISSHGGALLVADYGHDGIKGDTFRGFRGHKLHDVLKEPGTADLTADVDFSYLQSVTAGKVKCLGPITQQEFLRNMCIDVRLQVLLNNANNPSTYQQLINAYDMLMNPEKMGERFKFFAMVPHSRLAAPEKNHKKLKPMSPPVAGFSVIEMGR
ncbi:protein arginine methyltransferase NDUFAF7, mitochondrial [Protopterus annectens]|uniref:protein arginine methyltransferase NDUFAF7, mitochondrial n=1 Tax=Protopterus annectens TaxID=7888 RepID=UPI001CFC4467|nr:protein arginine methyltransferase NDUFAF7, mitochondrial [Protopterus annectens]